MSPLPSICFVAPMAYPMFAGTTSVAISGGAEVQQIVVARALARLGVSVSMVCFDFGQPERVCIEGVNIYRAHKIDAGWPGLRFLHPRLKAMWSAMRAADADVYYQRSAGALTGIVVMFARMQGRKSIVAGANNQDFDLRGQPFVRSRRDRWLHKIGVRNADAIVAQNVVQRDALKKHYGRVCAVIPNCREPATIIRANKEGGVVLWVGTVAPIKQPEELLKVAAALPGVRFRMVGGPRGDAAGAKYFHQIAASAAQLANVEFLGHVPYTEIDRHFDDACLLVNTSRSEGFPNTFLQAWSRGVPTVAMFDTGCRDADRVVGVLAQSADQVAAHVQNLLASDAAWQAEARRCFEHFEKHHKSSVVAVRYSELLRSLMIAPQGRTHLA